MILTEKESDVIREVDEIVREYGYLALAITLADTYVSVTARSENRNPGAARLLSLLSEAISIPAKMSLSNSNTYLSIPPYWKAKLISIDSFLVVLVSYESTLMRRSVNIILWCLIFWGRV